MDVHFIGIFVAAVPRPKRLRCVETLVVDERWIVEVPHLSVDLLDSVADADDAADGTGNVALDVEQTLIMIDSHDSLVEHRGADGAQATRHLLSLPNFTRILALTNGSWQSVRFRVAMRCLLPAEIPPLHDALSAFALARGLYINELAQPKVSRTKHEANG